MRSLVFMVAFIGVAWGQYNYDKPDNSLGSSSSNSESAISSTQQLPNKEFSGYNYQAPSSQQSSLISSSLSGSSSSQSSQSSSGFISSSQGSQASSSQLAPIIKKHYYVHVAPEEPEEAQSVGIQNNVAPEKHYKIIFIKVPSYKASQQAILNAQAKSEEKTLIYVLSQTPEAAEALQLPQSEPTKPSKPEVFFIKYKSQKGAVGDENQSNSDLSSASGYPDSSSTGYEHSQSSQVSSSSSSNGPLLNTFDTSSSQQAGFQAYGTPN